MSTVRQILKTKGSEVWSLKSDSTIAEAVRMLSDRNVGALVVMEGSKLIGLVSERDCARRLVLDSLDANTTPVSTIMATRVVCASLDQDVDACLRTMTDRQIRHLPVVEDEKLLGMISIGDLVKAVIAEQQFTIEQLEHYIAGS